MFRPSKKPRVFGCPPGVDFPKTLVAGLIERTSGLPPQVLARAEIFVSTGRMERRVADAFDIGPAMLLPKVSLISNLAYRQTDGSGPAAVTPLRRKLELSRLVAELLKQEPDLAPGSALFALSDSLSRLLGEMHDEAVSADAIQALDVSDRSGHWERSQKFLSIVRGFIGNPETAAPDVNARQRLVVESLIDSWANKPPEHPVIVAGSTGSRGTTALLMRAVARLPMGAVVLPGFDFDLPDATWKHLDESLTSEDHPQFLMRRTMSALGLDARDIMGWTHAHVPVPARNKLVSLALRPAPVTGQWMIEGPRLSDVSVAAEKMSLIEAPSLRLEAVAISLAMRQAIENGKTVALVTPDQTLTRRVRASLSRWHIEPDVSSGETLHQSAPGRLFRHVSDLFGRALRAEDLFVLLKHPLTNSAGGARSTHLDWTRKLELFVRREGLAFPTETDLLLWAEGHDDSDERLLWVKWIANTIFDLETVAESTLQRHVNLHYERTEALVSGPGKHAPVSLWEGPAGIAAKQVIDELRIEAVHAGIIGPTDYSAMFTDILRQHEVRDPVRPHPDIMIWGTRETRVQGADLVILGGLNDGVWPSLPAADPWLNREMRHRTGLPVPEIHIGLSAHDFQQAIAAKEVILSRAIRDDEAPSVASRWLNRLTNLLTGISDESRGALKAMRGRGEAWLTLAMSFDTPDPVPAAVRPAPRPNIGARPTQLSVTGITKLIQDPYAIYARYILRLRALDTLHQTPDASLRGTILHKVLETYIAKTCLTKEAAPTRATLLVVADEVLEETTPWPAIRMLWRAKLERVADAFLAGEEHRATLGNPIVLEESGAYRFGGLDFKLTANADRIDRTPDGHLIIYDYKTGQIPNKHAMEYFDKQLLLEALLAERGGFKALGTGRVVLAGHIGLGSAPVTRIDEIDPDIIAATEHGLLTLITNYQDPSQGYPSRRAAEKNRFSGDYDHLARFGEWIDATAPTPVDVE